MRGFLFWLFVIVAVIDAIGGIVGWLELRMERNAAGQLIRSRDSSSVRLSRILLAGAYRSISTVIGLYLFGLNVKAQGWFLFIGIYAVAYKAYSTWSWFAYLRNWINGGGWLGFFRKQLTRNKKL